MSKVFFCGFFWLATSTIAFIVSILTPFWIIKSNPRLRGIFEVCEYANNDPDIRACSYILAYNENPFILANRTNYAIACSILAIIASSIAIILIWISGIHMCLKSRSFENSTVRLRTSEILIVGTLFTDALTIIIWVVMLAMNLDSNNLITTNQIGWSLWLAVASTGGFLIALVLFCIHRIDLSASLGKRSGAYNESREYLQRF